MFIILLLAVVGGCIFAEKKERMEIHLETIAYNDIPWQETVGDFTHKLQIDMEVAEEIANLIFKQMKPDIMSSTDSYVYAVKDTDIVVVSRMPNNGAVGGDYNIAIDCSTGKILKMWCGE